ncbi:hypothetical protein LPJ63_001651 [Coemansia sp. RSA 2711]|nr:hypothetical protein LPJ63_001651 [Coemansia sp. RSA 2711]
MEYNPATTTGTVAAPEWLELFDPQTGRVVYANIVTGQCSWARPASPIAARDPNGEWWELADDESGVPYYYNSTTGATEWDPPAGATIVPFHALLTSSVGKRLSLMVSNRGSVAFTADQADSLSRRASRASLYSTDGRVSRKGSLARAAAYSPDSSEAVCPLPAADIHIADAAKSSSIAQTQSRLESGDRPDIGTGGVEADIDTAAADADRQRRISAQRHSQSETALETLKEALDASHIADNTSQRATPKNAVTPASASVGGDGDNEGEDEDEFADERRDHFDETPASNMYLGHADYSVPASATVETFGQSELAQRGDGIGLRPRIRSEASGASGTGAERMSALDYFPRQNSINSVSSVMMHSHRNRSMPSIRADSRLYGMRTFASTQFAAQKRGFLRRKVPLEEMVSYTSEALARPLMNLPRELIRDAVRSFRVMQRHMGNVEGAASDRFGDVLWLCNTGIRAPLMRDEILCQLAKQVTGNPSPGAAERGWTLLAVLLYAFHPSQMLQPHLEAFVDAAPVPTLQLRRLLRVQLNRVKRTGGRAGEMRKSELRLAMTVPSRPLVFGGALDEIVASPDLVNQHTGLPRVLEQLAALIGSLGGDRTEGLFRVPGDADVVAMTRLRIEAGQLDLSHVQDPNVPASLLKEWLRDLAEPLVPETLYEQCVSAPHDPGTALSVLALMPEASMRVLKFLLRFLAGLLQPSVQARTKMSASNLALVFGPTLLRNPANDLKNAFASSSGEQAFVLALLASSQSA